jgi:cold shock CspA family protein
MPVGRILRFDEARGYGFIAAAAGGEDVFVHASDFGEHRHMVHPGMRVEYEVEEGERGLKVASVRILDMPQARRMPPAFASAVARPASAERPAKASAADDDEVMCDVLSGRDFNTEVTEILLQHVPSLTGGQIAEIRQHLGDLARSHGWVES